MPRQINRVIYDEPAMAKALQLWQDIMRQRKFSVSEEQQQELSLIFGASWYFFRFVCFLGEEVLSVLHLANQSDAGQLDSVFASLLATLNIATDDTAMTDTGIVAENLTTLRVAKNKAMLFVLLLYLKGEYDIEKMECMLTRIATQVLQAMIRLFGLATDADNRILLMGMGRFAGGEMNFGSDLDLIFLAQGRDKYFEVLVRKTRQMLRTISAYDPAGNLYDIDMRLRPHGNSGTLIMSYTNFLAYHQEQREIWERQMMTRRLIVFSSLEESDTVQSLIDECIYQEWDAVWLRRGIVATRTRVEDSLARVPGVYDIKRSPGGIMDIDFIAHYFQLLYGRTASALRTAGTRSTLKNICKAELPVEQETELLTAYDYCKRIEFVLRVFDMKNIDLLTETSPQFPAVVRALGHTDDRAGIAAFWEEYHATTAAVRKLFTSILSTD